MKLADFQHLMTDFVFHNQATSELQSVIKNDQLPELERRLGIYKNNTFHSLIEAIKDLYPAVLATIGEALFSACARDYVEQHPPREAAMVLFGHEFPQFIAGFPSLAAMPYLADLARLELIRHHSYHAADEHCLAIEEFTNIEPTQLAAARVKVHTSAQLLTSSYAIFDIWRLAKGEITEGIHADCTQNVLAIRPALDVELYLIDGGTFQFLSQLQRGKSISDALSQATETHPEFKPTLAMSLLIQSGFVSQLCGESL